MDSLITGFHIFNIVILILVVLVQSGKGAEVSATFGGGSQTLFGSSGGANFFTYLTAGCAFLFMLTSVTLTIMGARQSRSTFDDAPGIPEAAQPAEQSIPKKIAPPANKESAQKSSPSSKTKEK